MHQAVLMHADVHKKPQKSTTLRTVPSSSMPGGQISRFPSRRCAAAEGTLHGDHGRARSSSSTISRRVGSPIPNRPARAAQPVSSTVRMRRPPAPGVRSRRPLPSPHRANSSRAAGPFAPDARRCGPDNPRSRHRRSPHTAQKPWAPAWAPFQLTPGGKGGRAPPGRRQCSAPRWR